MALKAIHHHKIFVSDMDKSLEFYRALGFEMLSDNERENLSAYDQIMGLEDVKVRMVVMKAQSEQLIVLIQFRNPLVTKREQSITFAGTQALALVVEDAQAEYTRLKEKGVPFESPPVDIVREGKVVAKANYLYDPDGSAIEIYQPI